MPGDIIEVQVSFAAFQTRNGNNKLEIVLRGLTLLDDRFSKVKKLVLYRFLPGAENTQAARIAKMKSDSDKRARPTPMVKRKTGYEDDDTELTRKKFKGLNMMEGTKDEGFGT